MSEDTPFVYLSDDLVWEGDFESQKGLVLDEIFAYDGRKSWGPGMCRLRIWHMGEEYIIMFSDIPGNSGTPVSFVFNRLASDAYRKYLRDVDPSSVRWIDHVPKAIKMAYGEVNMKWDNKKNTYTSASIKTAGNDVLSVLSIGIEHDFLKTRLIIN